LFVFHFQLVSKSPLVSELGARFFRFYLPLTATHLRLFLNG
jgi:hypothetical protein